MKIKLKTFTKTIGTTKVTLIIVNTNTLNKNVFMKNFYFILFKMMLPYDERDRGENNFSGTMRDNSYGGMMSDNSSLKRLSGNIKDVNHDGIIDESDKAFLRYIVEMYKSLTGERVDLNQFKSAFEALEMLKSAENKEYLNALLRPERCRGAKIPSAMPIPSSPFQLKSSFYVNTNSSGNACIAINPYYLTDGNLSTVFINNNTALSGLGITNNMFLAHNAGQSIPQQVYHQYRLVSASVICKYVGRLDIVQGLIGGAIVYDKQIVPTAVGAALPALDKYSDFNVSRDAFFQQEYYSIQGMRELYFPLDNSFEEYQSLNNSKDGFMFLLYIQNAPPSTASFKIDLFFNFECLPDVRFLNYIPTSISNQSPLAKDEAYKVVKQNPITKESDQVPLVKKGDFFGTLADKWGEYLPKIADIASKILPGLVAML
jgi:hypothetical protein